MKILISGAGGMLGTDLASQLSPQHQLVGTGRRPASHLQIPFFQLDLGDLKASVDLVRMHQPQIVLHAAAMTQVDLCETDRRSALQGNFETTKNMAEACNRVGALLVYFSTDFVFDGDKSSAYTEDDLPHPISVYGETKLLGEQYIRVRGVRHLILRTSWLFGKQGNNFPKKIIRQAEEGKAVCVVQDEFGSPTFTWDLAEGVAQLIDRLPNLGKDAENQIYHLANEGTVSRFEFARSIFKKRNLSLELLSPTSRESLGLPAARPRNSALSTEKIKKQFGIRLRPWEEALDDFLQKDHAGLRR